MRIFPILKNKNAKWAPRPVFGFLIAPVLFPFCFRPLCPQMLDGKGGINFKLNKGLGGNHGDCLEAGEESDTSESGEATETNGPKED